MNYKLIAVYTLVIIGISVGTTKKLWPTVDKQVKIEEREVIKKDIQTVIKEVVKVDGTKETTTTIIDHTKEASERTLEKIIFKKNDWFVAAGAETKLAEIIPVYKIEANRKIFGDVFLGVTVSTQGAIGLQLGFQF